MKIKKRSVIIAAGCAVGAIITVIISAVIFTPPKIYISEICPDNDGEYEITAKVTDKTGEYCDWIEIYNPTDKDVSLSGFSLSKNGGERYKLGNYTVKAKEHIIVYCSKEGFDGQDFPTAGFNIGKANGDTVTLNYRFFERESVTLPVLNSGVSYSRNENGEMYVSEPTPMAENSDKTIGDTPELSVQSGMYEEPFSLEIYAGEGQKIYYTTDGTDPAVSSTRQVYTDSLEISDRSGDKNVLSAYDPMKIQLDYREENIGLPSDTDVDKCTVIRACAEGTSGICGKTVTASYFVGISSAEHSDLPIISMITDPDDLYSEQDGIYCLGEVYEEYDEQYPDHARNGSVPANYNQRGREWEKECYIEYFDSDGKRLISQDCGVRTQGGWSRADYQKSFRFYARGDYGKGSFDYPLLEDLTDKDGNLISSYKTFVLRNGGNDANYSKFKDTMIQDMVSGRESETQKGKACVLFIDGEYWGLYTLQNDYSDDYFSDVYGVSKSNVIVYKNDKLDEGEPQDEKLFDEMCDFISLSDMSDEENYKKACTMLDMDSFADYVATECYIFNDDWPQNNYACWRVRDIESSNKYADGRWRFMLFDTESSGNHYNTKYDTLNMFDYLEEKSHMKLGGMIISLLDSEAFRMKFISSICQVGSVNFEYGRFEEYLEYYKSVYYDELDNYFKRFPTWADKNNATDKMLGRWDDFMENRFEKVQGYLEREYRLSPQRRVEISSSDCEHGKVTISGVVLEKDCIGSYYDGCEITLSARAEKGWRFVRWEGVPEEDEENRNITVKVDGDMEIKAVFKKSFW